MQLSIITVNYNNLEGLKKTFESVFIQEEKKFEFIIIDGGSTDGSRDFIESNQTKLNYWLSERDGGIYNAMNKGIKVAKGKYLLFLNSGDELYSKNVLGYFKSYKEDLIYFDVNFQNRTSSFIHKYPIKLTFNYFLKYSLPHQGTLIKRDLFSTVGLYRETYKICSDWAFFIDTIFRFGGTYKKVSKIFAKLDRDGISCDPNNLEWIENERMHFLNENYKNENLVYIEEHLPTEKKRNILNRTVTKLFKKALRNK